MCANEILLIFSGTFFHLLEDTAHPCLSVSEDGFAMFYSEEELPLSEMVFSDNTFARWANLHGHFTSVINKDSHLLSDVISDTHALLSQFKLLRCW